MKTSTLLMLAAAGGAYYFYGARLGLRKLDESTPGTVVTLAKGKTYEATFLASDPKIGTAIAASMGGASQPITGGFVVVQTARGDNETLRIGEDILGMAKLIRVREL